MKYLKEDNIKLEDLSYLERYSILENSKPKLCTDRLDGVLGICYICLQTHSLNSIKNVYNHLVVLNEKVDSKELGFTSLEVGKEFVQMVFIYSKELQKNKNKYVMKYLAEIIKLAVSKNYMTLEDLYHKKEEEIVKILNSHFSSFKSFQNATKVVGKNQKPNHFYISFQTKKRVVIPLVKQNNKIKRITETSSEANQIYQELDQYQDYRYAYIQAIKEI